MTEKGELKWAKAPESLPPLNKKVLAINRQGFVTEAVRTKGWNSNWTGQKAGGKPGTEIVWWQYWTELPKLPENIENQR